MSLNTFVEFEIENNLKVSNNLEVLQDINVSKNISLTGTSSILNLRTIKSNIPTSGADDDPSGNYIDISGSTLLIPRGTTAERMSVDPTGIYGVTAKAGMIMYDTNQNQFVGVVGKSDGELVWTGLGGVISLDQKTRIEASNILDSDGIKFYADDAQRMIINKDGNFGFGDLDELVDNSILSLPSDMDFTFYKNSNPKILISSYTTTNTKGLVLEVKADKHSYIYNNGDDGNLILGAGNLDRMYIDICGNVGIGAASSGGILEMKPHTSSYIRFTDKYYNNSNRPGIVFGNSQTEIDNKSNYPDIYQYIHGSGDRSLVFVNNRFGFFISDDSEERTSLGTEVLSILNDGNVGIGEASPRVKLQVGSNIIDDGNLNTSSGVVSWDPNAMLIVHQTPTSNTALNDPKPVLYLGRQGTSGQAYGQLATFSISRWENNGTNSRTRLDIKLDHNNPGTHAPTDVMTLRSNGNVGIGTTSPGAKLEISGENDVSDDIKVRFISYGNSAYTTETGIWLGAAYSTGHDTAKAAIIGSTWSSSNRVKLDFCLENTATTNSRDANLSDSRMTILPNGNVGIGATSPENLLHLAKTVSRDPTNDIEDLLHLEATYSSDFSGSYREGGCSILFTAQNSGETAPGEAARIVAGCYESSSSDEYHSYLAFHTSNNSNATGTNERMCINDEGYVGIGTTTPDEKLHVEGSIKVDNPGIIWLASYIKRLPKSENTYMGFPQSNTISFGTNSAERMRIDSAGNVGIGETSPVVKLHVNGSILVNTYASGQGGTGGIFFRENNAVNNLYNCSIMNYAHNDTSTPDGISINGFDGVSICTGDNDRNERMRVDANGKVGIGVTNPTCSLDIRAPDNSEAKLILCGSTQGTGNLYVGQSTTYGGGIIYNGDGSPDSKTEEDCISFYRKDNGTISEVFFYAFNNNTVNFRGDITAFYTSSDKRLKTNIETIDNSLDILKNIRGVRFNWNEKAKKINNNVNLDKKEMGVIAQEIEPLIPEVIKKGISGYKAVRYEKLTPFLISCIKEQQTQIENQQTQIESQQTQITSLQSQITSLQSQIDELKALIKNN